MAAVADALALCPQVTLRDMALDSWSGRVLWGAIARASTLRSLSLHQVEHDVDVLPALHDALRANASLHDLQLRDCDVLCDGASALAAGLAHATGLRSLAIDDRRARPHEATMLLSALPNIGQLRQLELSRVTLDSTSVRCLSTALGALTHLQTLQLADTELSSATSAILVQGLASCPSLRQLTVSRADWGEEGTLALAEWLHSHRPLQLQHMSLQGGSTTAEGVATLVAAVSAHPSIRHVGLDDLEPMLSIGAFAQLINPGRALRTLSLRGAQLDSRGSAYFAQRLVAVDHRLRCITLSPARTTNVVSASSLASLASVLSHNQLLEIDGVRALQILSEDNHGPRARRRKLRVSLLVWSASRGRRVIKL